MNKQKVLVALEKLRDTALEGHREYEILYISKVSSSHEQGDPVMEKLRQTRRTIHELFETIWEEVI